MLRLFVCLFSLFNNAEIICLSRSYKNPPGESGKSLSIEGKTAEWCRAHTVGHLKENTVQ